MEAQLDSHLALREPMVGCRAPLLSFAMKEVSGAFPNRAALHVMGFFSYFMENIDEDGRWNGRTQSGVSWSPEQLHRAQGYCDAPEVGLPDIARFHRSSTDKGERRAARELIDT